MNMKTHFKKHQFYCAFACFGDRCFMSAVFYIDFDAFLFKSCSIAAPAALGGCGGLGQLWEALWQSSLYSVLTVQRAH